MTEFNSKYKVHGDTVIRDLEFAIMLIAVLVNRYQGADGLTISQDDLNEVALKGTFLLEGMQDEKILLKVEKRSTTTQ